MTTTVFSLSADPPAALPKAFDPDHSALDAASLTSDAARHSCFVRKFGAAGATLRTEEALEPGQAFLLELHTGQSIPGAVGWATEDEAGFVFDAPIDVVSALARNLAKLPAERRRVPRVELRHPVGIRRAEQFDIARTRDISQAGIGIETRIPLAENDVVHVALDGLPSLSGTVKWSREGKSGIEFEHELSWQTLMPWLREAQRAPAPRPSVHALGQGRDFGLGKDKAAIRLDAAARVREGARWWNVQIRMLTPTLVEFEAAATFAKGAQLWVSLPGAAGWPATILEADNGHYLAEFRLPLRKHDMDQISPTRLARG